jgi:hypothetical protein
MAHSRVNDKDGLSRSSIRHREVGRAHGRALGSRDVNRRRHCSLRYNRGHLCGGIHREFRIDAPKRDPYALRVFWRPAGARDCHRRAHRTARRLEAGDVGQHVERLQTGECGRARGDLDQSRLRSRRNRGGEEGSRRVHCDPRSLDTTERHDRRTAESLSQNPDGGAARLAGQDLWTAKLRLRHIIEGYAIYHAIVVFAALSGYPVKDSARVRDFGIRVVTVRRLPLRPFKPVNPGKSRGPPFPSDFEDTPRSIRSRIRLVSCNLWHRRRNSGPKLALMPLEHRNLRPWL